jgi:hypothetical protein
MAVSSIRVLQSYHHNTFQERGVQIPFTLPRLVGTRARMVRGGELELLVPNRSGTAGFIIVPWSGVRSVARPTVHDGRLCGRIAAVPTLTPIAVRQEARAVALEGLAGRAVMEAAQLAEQRDAQDARAAARRLLLRLSQQIEGGDTGPSLVLKPPTPVEQTIKRAAALLGQSPQRLEQAIDRLSRLLSATGIGRSRPSQEATPAAEPDAAAAPRVERLARLPQQLVALATLQQEVGRWALRTNEDGGYLTRHLMSAIQATRTCAPIVLADVTRRAETPLELLGGLFSAPAQLEQIIARPDWILDGWEHVLVRWQGAGDDAERHAVLRELGPLIPPLPKEAGDWTKLRIDYELSTTGTEGPPSGGAEPPSRLLGMIDRNEGFQAAAMLAGVAFASDHAPASA